MISNLRKSIGFKNILPMIMKRIRLIKSMFKNL